jgi:hypothetical protein
MSKDRMLAAKAEVQSLLDANVIREVKYSEWLENCSTSTKEEWQNENVHRFH